MRLLFSLYLLLLVAGCGSQDDTAQSQRHRQNSIDAAESLVADLVYVKDVRTGLCFAYAWGGQANGGPILTNVDCRAIPAVLLVPK